jgi:hypothetical protein
MDLDRQSIERRDFPIGRRGYDPAAVDAHLRALASAVEDLKRAAAAPGPDSLAASAGSQVQAIVAAAEVAAAEIESEAQANAQRMREEAERDAQKTRADAVAQAQAHAASVGRATATLLARVESLDGETGALVDSMRTGATKLASELAAMEANMGELYDAAAGRAASPGTDNRPSPDPGEAQQAVSAVAKETPEPHVPPRPKDVPAPPVASVAAQASVPSSPPASRSTPSNSTAASTSTPPAPAVSTDPSSTAPSPTSITAPRAPTPPVPSPAEPSAPPSTFSQSENGDVEGARLVALNMALNGDSREATDEYLAENYEIEDRQKLLDEVYAAIEG